MQRRMVNSPCNRCKEKEATRNAHHGRPGRRRRRHGETVQHTPQLLRGPPRSPSHPPSAPCQFPPDQSPVEPGTSVLRRHPGPKPTGRANPGQGRQQGAEVPKGRPDEPAARRAWPEPSDQRPAVGLLPPLRPSTKANRPECPRRPGRAAAAVKESTCRRTPATTRRRKSQSSGSPDKSPARQGRDGERAPRGR